MAGGGCITIDDAAKGGSPDGAWHTHIAHTPALRAQCLDEFPSAPPSGRIEQARNCGEPVPLLPGTGSPPSAADTS